jgi:hypothetical protein
MAFKKKEFDQAKLTYRIIGVPVPGMKEWFDGDPIWHVRGLTGNELGRCQEMSESRKSLTEIIQDILVKKNDESTTDYIPKENALRIEYLMVGSVDPECDQDLAIKINESYPIEFRILTAKILELTGQGQTVGKQTPSGEIPASEQA